MKIKSLVLLIILTALCLFVGCGDSATKRPDLSYDYEFEAVINYSDEAFTVKCQKTSERWEFVYVLPAEIKDMCVVLENGQYKITYNGLIQEGDRDAIPKGNVCDFVARSLEYIAKGKGMEFTSENDKISGKGVFDGGDLTASYNKNRLPEEIIIGKDIEIKFTSFKKT